MNKRLRPLLAIAALVLAGVGFFVYRAVAEQNRETAAKEQLFADIDRVIAQGPQGNAELSALVSRLHKLDASDPGVALALAKVELSRQRYDNALRLLEPLVLGGSLELRRTAAKAALAAQAAGGGETTARQSMLRQVVAFAESAASTGGDADDVFLGWLAALRLGDDAMRTQFATRLQQEAGTLAARTVALLANAGDLAQPIEPVASAIAEWPIAPVELRLLRVALRLQAGEVDGGCAEVDELLVQAPNLLDVRNVAATAHHMAGLVQPEGADRDRHLRVRDEQIRWLDANADASDSRRPQWLAMRQQH